MTKEMIEGFRLSPQQKHLWLLQQADYCQTYISRCSILIEGDISERVLEEALRAVTERHEILRTRFYLLPGMTIPVQVIKGGGLSWLQSEDLTGMDRQEQATRIEALYERLTEPYDDLQSGPLLQARLVNLSAQKHVLLLRLPALCADQRSLELMAREIGRSYSACLNDEEIAGEAVQYADTSEALNELIEADDTEAGRVYWRKELPPDPFSLRLPFEAQAAQGSAFTPRSIRLAFEQGVGEKIKSLARQNNIAEEICLLACWQILLARLVGQPDIVIGVAYDGRSYEELIEALGLFEKYLPLSCRIDEQGRFDELLDRVAKQARAVGRWQDYFAWDAGVSSEEPFLPFLFSTEQEPAHFSAAGVTFSLLKHQACTERFRIKLSCFQSPGETGVEFHYDPRSFSESDMRRLAGEFETLVGHAADNPRALINQLRMLSDAERHQVLVEFNATRAEYPDNVCLHELFEAQAERAPGLKAVASEDEQITYGELNRRANKLAHYLRELGAGPESLVGICVDRSLDMVVAALGVLKAGAAYVPLDPSYPAKRLSYMLEDSKAKLLLTHEQFRGQLPQNAIKQVYLDRDREIISSYSEQNLSTAATPDNLAYAIYTSGSTGSPKGAINTHAGICNRLLWMQKTYQLEENDCVLQKTPFSFDVSVWEFFWPLLTGAHLVLAVPGGHQDSTYLVNLIKDKKITTLHFVPSMLHAFLEEPGVETCTSIKRVICSGEALSYELQQHFFSRMSAELHNLYGPTEASVDVTFFHCSPDYPRRTVPIGKPIANTQIYILDEHLQPVPVGVAGEIHIGGVGLARGYLDRPDLTAEKFIPDPHGLQPGARLYKTGDLARFLPDGNIEFLGRIDHQVKVRGFRIELGEIEAVLRRHPAVNDAVIVAHDDSAGNRQLVAYIVSNHQPAPNVSELRRFASEGLPDYMIPALYVVLDHLPLTPSGKLDRRALPRPDHARPDLQKEYLAPRTREEETLARIWAQVLNVERVGIHDNFFELGGHSLLATQITSRVRDSLHAEISLPLFFEMPTVAAQAEIIAKQQGEQSGPVTFQPAIRQGADRGKSHPLSFAQERMWFLEQLAPGNAYNCSFPLCIEGKLNPGALRESFNEVIRRHDILRTTFTIEEDQPVQIASPEQPVSIPLIDLSELPEADRQAQLSQLVSEEYQRRFNLSAGPLLRFKLVKMSEQQHVALLVIHHIIMDGWSLNVLISELASLYDAFCNHKPYPLTQLPIQYADFAVWQRQWLQGEVLEEQVAYWRKQFENAPLLLALPTDRPRHFAQAYRSASHPLELSESLAQKLKELSQQERVTMFMTLFAAFNVLLYRYSNQEQIIVGTPIANRNRAETESLIGFFVNTLAVRTDLSGGPSFKEVVGRVREQMLGAYAHQDLPFEKLVEQLQPERSLSHNPLFQVMFILQNAPIRPLNVHDLTVRALDDGSIMGMFDLVVNMIEAEEGLKASWTYNANLFDADTISQMASHFRELLKAIAAEPETVVDELPMMSESEQRRLLVEWNLTATEYPKGSSIQEQFEKQASQRAESVAVEQGREWISYGEMNKRANQLGHYLRGIGVGPEVRVGICMDRSIELIVGVLGIIKAGGAYVPLDPAYPSQRLALILEDAQAPVLIVQQELLKHFADYHGRVVCIDSDWDMISRQSEENPDVDVTGENLAYVMYTSGSTGKPKGVEIPHRGVLRLLFGVDYVELDSDKTMLLMSPFAFDAATFELWGALLHGGRCVLFDGRVPSAQKIQELIRQRGITTMWLTASLYNALIVEAPEALKGLHQLLIGGEALSVPHVIRGQEALPITEIINGYGPTESTTFTCCYSIPRHDESITSSVPIGRPISNTQLFILDSEQRPVPQGVAGELYIGGDGLARGYINRPDLTAERFVPHAFGDQPGARLYRTGDLARYLSDGRVEFLGRIDNQVKVRGFRIELSEIEVLLSQHPGTSEVIVLVREDAQDDKRLVAYVVAQRQRTTTAQELRAYLKDRLPDYMIPSAFVFLEAMPLLSNGKVDRHQLPAPAITKADYQAPVTELERFLAASWQQLLKVDGVGRDDNFFELGGHSIKAVLFTNKLQERLGESIPVALVFETPTISGLAAYLETNYPDAVRRIFGSEPLSGNEQEYAMAKAATSSLQPIPSASRTDKGLEQLLEEVSLLSDQEAQALLADQTWNKDESDSTR